MKYIRIILKKELLDTLRDKRSMFMALLPILVFPLIFMLFNSQSESITNDVSAINAYNTISNISDKNINNEASAISSICSMLLVMLVSTGGGSIAIDMFCGEKERGSFEALLSTQVSRFSLFTAKVLNVLIFVCFNTFISLFALFLSLKNFSLTNKLSFAQIALTVLTIFSFSLFISAIISVLSLSSKSSKEGQLKVNIVTLIPTLAFGLTTYLNNDVKDYIYYIPFENVITAIKELLENTFSIANVFITIIILLLYSLFILLLGNHILKKYNN